MAATPGYGYGVTRRRRGKSGLVFTDDLADGAGTPVAITTPIATRQAWKRGATVPLAGTYDVTGGDPTSMAARIGGKAWVELRNQVINTTLKTWAGDLVYPYYGQGALEIKPVNGLNVTPASVANITSGKVFLIAPGQSNALGRATNNATFVKTLFDAVKSDDAGAWGLYTVDPLRPGGNGSPWPAFCEALDQAGSPPVLVPGNVGNGTGFKGNDWNQGDPNYAATVADANVADPKGVIMP